MLSTKGAGNQHKTGVRMVYLKQRDFGGGGGRPPKCLMVEKALQRIDDTTLHGCMHIYHSLIMSKGRASTDCSLEFGSSDARFFETQQL